MSILARKNYISNGYSLGHFYKKKISHNYQKFYGKYKKKFQLEKTFWQLQK